MLRVALPPRGGSAAGLPAAASLMPWLGLSGRCGRLAFASGGAPLAAGAGRPFGQASRRSRSQAAAAAELGTKWMRPQGRDTGIQTYNSLSRSKEPLILGNADVVTWYSCGPTVYDHAHLGHACSYVRFDIIRRIMTKIFGKEVVMVMGITDIDDKIIKRASEMAVSPVTLARFYEEDFKQDMAALKVLPPTIYMRVTENIPQIISFIQQIVASGHGYATSKGNVYFDVRSRGDRYGKLTNIYPDAQEEVVDSDKCHTKDFALWKAAKPQEMCWDSPWGKGRPGWHIECSTISSLVFGGHLDIHTGGIDLAFPHHENEIAQCEVYHKCDQWGNYFLHSGHLHVKGSEKMSKSLKNYITIKNFLKKSSPDQFRMFCLRSKYRSAIEYSDDTLNDAKNILNTINSFMSSANAYMKGQLTCEAIREDVLWQRLANTKATVKAACADDFDTPRAVGAIMDLIHHGNRQLKAVTKETGSPRSAVVFGAIVSYMEDFLDTVGIALDERQVYDGQVAPERKHSAMLSSVIDELVSFRIKVRDFALAMPEGAGHVPSEGTGLSREEKQQQKEERRRLMQDRAPLLQACDSLRQDLALYGINIKDRSTTSTWELGEPSKELEKS
ncbi:probable cysteine--tRNA ligase, mitochondrial isoform X1 [Tiliqua scincoides]|uniref:probable cysteine--tRNA ligase, mitochondrial isoform X1 n=2 Tax=Tiliqua scincoides TaxID=71010 RepID=UPI0034632D64